MAETFLQRGRLLLQVDRSGVRRQLGAGQRSSLTSPVRVLAGLLGPTRCLASFLRDATNLRNGLLSQVAKALQGLGLIIPTHGWPAIVNKPVDRLARSPRAWPVAAPPNYRPVAPPWCRSGRDRGLACSAEGTLHA